MKKYILFVCGHNTGRSQMAQAFFNREKTKFPSIDQSYEAVSAGTRPGSTLNPAVVQTMKEAGIEMNPADYFPKGLDTLLQTQGKNIERIIVACDDKCEIFPGIKPEHWNLPDPHQKPLEEVKKIRELIRRKVLELIKESESAHRQS
ncbi:MAG: arsenate reductase ArsC [Candidatus Diapherotrites archaeon]|nr:arsenate reductase ArsC [Candidatus Diapherotrites archaeon]